MAIAGGFRLSGASIGLRKLVEKSDSWLSFLEKVRKHHIFLLVVSTQIMSVAAESDCILMIVLCLGNHLNYFG
jgi:hypothetical protein